MDVAPAPLHLFTPSPPALTSSTTTPPSGAVTQLSLDEYLAQPVEVRYPFNYVGSLFEDASPAVLRTPCDFEPNS